MRYLTLFLSVVIIWMTILYTSKIRELEMVILQFYKSDFKEYVMFDGNQNIVFNKEKLNEYFKEMGYCVAFEEDDLRFTISFQRVFYFKKEYYFYIQKNDEIK